MKKKIKLGTVVLLLSGNILAQDPHFSQFFMAPQSVNPALVGSVPEAWRIMSNYRQQWSSAGTPFTTFTFGGDATIYTGTNENGSLSGGLQLMRDQSMHGAFKSSYVSGTLAYHHQLNEGNRIGIGFQGSYGARTIDYAGLTFGEQFTSRGFDVTVPTGENQLFNHTTRFSLAAGLLYNFTNENYNFDVGVAAFHLNNPPQTLLNSNQQVLATRYVAHAGMAVVVSPTVIISSDNIYQQQDGYNYFSLGGAVGFDVSEGVRKTILQFGCWLRKGDAIYPYAGLIINNFQFGLSYDVTTSKQNKGPMVPQSFELSLALRQPNKTGIKIPCPGW